MRTVLAHEWLAPTGGSENVFEQLMEIYPDSRNICLWNDAPQRFPRNIEETWVARTPLRRSKALSLPFLSRAWKSVDLASTDRVIVSSHAFGHHLAARAADAGLGAYSYVHTPARYVWAPEFDDRGQSRLARAGRRHFMKTDRRATSSRVNYVANSEFVRDRIRAAWEQDAGVIYPPVEIDLIQGRPAWRDEVVDAAEIERLDGLPLEFVLGASRLVEYKRLDTAITVGEELGLPVVIVGSGPDEDRLRELAAQSSVPVTFFGYASTPALYALYQAAALFVFMAIEDFGIMPVEAMALGTPVLVRHEGGARESIERVGGGVVIEGTSAAQLREGGRSAIDIPMDRAIDAVSQFSRTEFSRRVRAWAGEAS